MRWWIPCCRDGATRTDGGIHALTGTLIFLVAALIAGIPGFGRIAGAAATIAKVPSLAFIVPFPGGPILRQLGERGPRLRCRCSASSRAHRPPEHKTLTIDPRVLLSPVIPASPLALTGCSDADDGPAEEAGEQIDAAAGPSRGPQTFAGDWRSLVDHACPPTGRPGHPARCSLDRGILARLHRARAAMDL